jgi:uncharacterized cupin superfamily protein
MRRADLSTADVRFDPEDPPGFRAAMARFGPGFGAVESGASLYVLPPGEALCPYHYEYGEEEWLLVLEGRATVRDPDGTAELGPGELVYFPNGPEGAHQVRNDSGDAVRVLLWSTIETPAVTAYPDSDKVGVYVRPREESLLVRRESAVDYYDGESNG